MQLLLIVLLPYVLTRLTRRLGTESWLSPVVLSYLAGILLANLDLLPLDAALSHRLSEGAVVAAIPLLLFSTDLKAWWRQAPAVLWSFAGVVVCGLGACAAAAWAFRHRLEEVWVPAGMLVGVYTGGTPNMNAVGIALGAEENLFVYLNAADILCGGVVLVFFTSVAHRCYGWLLPDYPGPRDGPGAQHQARRAFGWRQVLLNLALALAVGAAALALTYLLSGGLEQVGLLILLLSALSVGLSFSPRIRNLPGTFETGDYLLLMFCVAVGMLADFGDLYLRGGTIVAFTAAVLGGTLLLHLLLCRLLRIDRDTALITATAALYGPPFIGQVASVIGNRRLVFAGIATGLAGYAIGNFLGIGMAHLLQQWLQ
ncbi:MAG: DUF819 family protein [Bacteroidetes bacterium]|nr:MAG: DUF819 family protein [Bacteroidota bacterium]